MQCDVSVDCLLFEEAPPRPLVGFKEAELVEQFKLVDQMDPSARMALKRIINTLAAEKNGKEAIA